MWHCEKCGGAPGAGVGCVCTAQPAASAEPGNDESVAVLEKFVELAKIVDTAVDDWGETFPDGSCQVVFPKKQAEALETILEYFDGLPNIPDPLILESGPLRAARALLSRYGRPAGDAQPVADHKFYPHPGYRAFCQKCGKAEADHPTAPVAAQKADDALRTAVKTAYGYLWHVNNEPGTPNQYAPERAAYEARKMLRAHLTNDERGEGINAARAAIAQQRKAIAGYDPLEGTGDGGPHEARLLKQRKGE